MTIREIYDLAVQKGKEKDPRGLEAVDKALERAKKEYEDLKAEDREYFDTESLHNPYADTRILYGDDDRLVKRVLVGVDIEVGEVLLADRLREKEGLDLIIAHHPEGGSLAKLYQVMHMQGDILANYGVPINVAEGHLQGRISEVERGLLPVNHQRAIDAARLLDIPLMCVHTPADNCVTSYLQGIFDERQPYLVKDVLAILKEIPEYQAAGKIGAGLKVVAGGEKRRAGKVFVDMTGGTGGAKELFASMANAGIGTVVCMHISEKNLEKAKEAQLNVVIAGHMASDSVGMNFILDEIAKRGVEILTCSGLIRVSRL
ncbi:MAG: NGG1p interacting factor NIF3 [Limnochordia bacterium]